MGGRRARGRSLPLITSVLWLVFIPLIASGTTARSGVWSPLSSGGGSALAQQMSLHPPNAPEGMGKFVPTAKRTRFGGVVSVLDRFQNQGSNQIIVTFFSAKMLAFAQNWACSLKRLSLARGAVGVLVTTTASDLCDAIGPWMMWLGNAWGCVQFTVSGPKDNGLTVTYASAEYKAEVAGKLVAYEAVLRAGAALPQQILLFFSDVDVVFKANPFDYWNRVWAAQNMSLVISSGDKAGTNLLVFDGDGVPIIPCTSTHEVPNTGLFFARSDRSMAKVFKTALHIIRSGAEWHVDYAVMAAIKKSSANVGWLPCSQFVNGNWLFGHSNCISDATAYHANWIVNSDTKLACMKAAGIWYLVNQSQGLRRFLAASTTADMCQYPPSETLGAIHANISSIGIVRSCDLAT